MNYIVTSPFTVTLPDESGDQTVVGGVVIHDGIAWSVHFQKGREFSLDESGVVVGDPQAPSFESEEIEYLLANGYVKTNE